MRDAAERRIWIAEVLESRRERTEAEREYARVRDAVMPLLAKDPANIAANAELAIAELGLGRLALTRAQSGGPSAPRDWRAAREALATSVGIWR